MIYGYSNTVGVKDLLLSVDLKQCVCRGRNEARTTQYV